MDKRQALPGYDLSPELDADVALVEYWYDRRARHWVVQRKCAAGCQLGGAEMPYARAGAEATAREWAATYAVPMVKT